MNIMTAKETLQSVFCTLSQGLDDDILEASVGRWADAAASYCLGMPPQIVLKSMTKHRDRVEKTLCKKKVCRTSANWRTWSRRRNSVGERLRRESDREEGEGSDMSISPPRTSSSSSSLHSLQGRNGVILL